MTATTAPHHLAPLADQARQTAVALVYQIIALLIEAPGNHEAALAALDDTLTALAGERE